MIKRIVKIVLPWLITVTALYIAFRGIDWQVLLSHLGEAKGVWIAAAVFCTVLSYMLRSRRWQYLFTKPTVSYVSATKVLILGFFMNNVLPARAGELVRAHLGARVTGESRTLVLATIASERLIDGLTLSLFFVVFSISAGDERLSEDFFLVACAFAMVAVAVLTALFFRGYLFSFAERCHLRFDTTASKYAFERFQIFVNGLSPLFSRSKILLIILWSVAIWSVELMVYRSISLAYNADLPLSYVVLFLVAVNFSSLIPSAPGGIGVIEAVGSQVLASVGVPRELALTMVITQHAIQYLVVGIPGACLMLTWKRQLQEIKDDSIAD